MADFDVIVVGAGPAGLSAGTTTAQSGLTTLIIEEHQEIGRPLACGEGISAEKLLTLENMPKPQIQIQKPRLELQRTGSFIERGLNVQRFFFGNTGVATSNLPTFTINRPRFDQIMAETAAKKGAELSLGTQATGFQHQDQMMRIQTTNGDYTCNVVIGCDGPSAHSVRRIGLEPPAQYVSGVEYQIEGVHTDALEFYFDFLRLPKMHYGWVFPKRNCTNVGIISDPLSHPMKILDEFVEYLNHKEIRNSGIVKKIAGIIPASGPIPRFYTDNFLAAGDAAGLTNSIFYGGIAIAVHSGMLAGQTAVEVHANNRFDEKQLSIYHKKIMAMDYTNPTIKSAHDILYAKFTGKDLENFGQMIDGWNITSLSAIQKLVLPLKALFHPRLLLKFRDARIVAQGFSISRDWGF
ncbi:MAG: geranylgeranyl reductase family protein [Candidatus Heimdallarchaeota archaeon]